ncbi:gamma-butyrobetaine hydroxylase-like domain-containing protein [Pokkaliibacter sp. CJK22405]|uniref:gamma-butyrobetaine hydroxylase-like domain-containing protein n=1 Tax=Pokkaliibacter sp. CJK22405 TaxID=3384615 RepID=UPI0039856678
MTPRPTAIKLHKGSNTLELVYPEGRHFHLPAEFLRVHSPSAEVRGHGKGNEVLQIGKVNVRLVKVEPSGQYAVKMTFDDGHDSGLYTWDYLFELCVDQEAKWQSYLKRLDDAKASRDPSESVVRFL